MKTISFAIIAILISCAVTRVEVSAEIIADVSADVTIDTIVKKSIEAAGGEKKLASIKTVTLRGAVSVPAQGVEGTFSIDKKTDRAVMRVDLKGLGEIRYGWLKDVVYETSDLTGTRIIDGTEREQLLRDLDMTQTFTRLNTLKDLRIDGEEDVRGQKAWRITGTTESDTVETNWIDQTTFLPARMRMIVDTQMGRLEAVVDFKDYKIIDGLPIPMTTEQAAGPMLMVLKIEEVKINPDIADAAFDLPDEVKDLLKTPTTLPAGAPTTMPAK